jgi:hypothetical protein
MNPNAWPETVVIWGAGATKEAGLLTTKDLANSLNRIFEDYPDFDFDFSKVFPNHKIAQQLQNGLRRLLNRLFNDEHIKYDYDIEALSLIIKNSSMVFDIETGKKDGLNMQELFSFVDQLIDSGLGLEVCTGKAKCFLNSRRIIGARNCLKLLVEELQRMVLQGTTPGRMSNVKWYHDFASVLAALMVREAYEYENRKYPYHDRSFYLYSYAFISFNWDPLFLWATFAAHKKINDSLQLMRHNLPLRLFADLGSVIATRKVKGDSDKISYSANETQCININDGDYPSRIMRIGKFLFPHGIFGSRLCPQCGKMLISFGHKWDKYSSLPFGPSLVHELQHEWNYNSDEHKELAQIKCPFCGQMTHPYNMPLEMQSMIKKHAIAPLDEMKKEMGLLIKHAKHVVFAGYSMPTDDLAEKLFFVTSLSGRNVKKKECTIILFDEDFSLGYDWFTGQEILQFLNDSEKKGTSAYE